MSKRPRIRLSQEKGKMGGEHGLPEVPKVPSWKIYHVEDVPQLMAVKKALSSHGLKDPWLRNEVWRYTEQENKNPFGRTFFRCVLSKGFKYGLGAAIITTAIESVLFRKSSDDHDHH